MGNNRYCLTDEGWKALSDALNKLYPNGYEITQLTTITGLDRGATIPKILQRPPEYAVFRSKIVCLFEKIDEELKERKLGNLQLKNSYFEEARFPPRPKSKTHTKSTPSPGSPDRVITDLLWTLNCRQQEAHFGDSLQYLQPAGTFLGGKHESHVILSEAKDLRDPSLRSG
ncbi:hypothetical protein [Oscillatoria salina]|uniref:hypothetical protein n=1 Tax=Oscillatoria salina TaxID=331517 RepID=UPI0013BC215B|nr:hypothetical protein [Oscillatoria salina]MBZ8178899.1 hypothetical protein [Oscillatoria salina IIICB1]NET86675.1 hypothetical protein [Kamptonema sp. SIO1D9]